MSPKLAKSPEWGILEAVQPLFAAELPWRLIDPERGNSIQGDASRIEIENCPHTFRQELGLLVHNLPQNELSKHSLKLCERDLQDLLQFLEGLVLDQVLEFSKDNGEQSEEEVKDDDASVDRPNVIYTGKVWRWLGWTTGESRPLQSPRKPSETVINNPRSTLQICDKLHGASQYRRLEALGIVLQTSYSEDYSTCYSYLKFEQTLTSFRNGASLAKDLNERLEGLVPDPGSTSFQTSAAELVPKARWKSHKPWTVLERLFRRLTESSCHGHVAKLRLNGFSFDEYSNSSPPIDMFISSCTPRTYWQDCRCTSIASHDLTVLPHRDERRVLSDVCDYIQTSETQVRHRLLIVEFNHRSLRYWPSGRDTSIHAGAPSMVSFNDLLDKGLLRTPGGMFDVNDKAVLALSLSTCLLHLVEGPWLQNIWNGNNIQFIGQDSEICDVWHPYMMCPVTEQILPQTSTPIPMVLSFARLLVELETGKRVNSDPSLSTFEDDIFTIQENEIVDSGREDYIQAIEGCFRVKAGLLRARVKLDSGKDPSYLHILREVIYDNVVSRLERNFSQIPRKTRREILPIINGGKRATRSGIPSHTGHHSGSVHISNLAAPNRYAPYSAIGLPSFDRMARMESTMERRLAETKLEWSDSGASNSGGVDLNYITKKDRFSPDETMKKISCSTMFFDGVSTSEKHEHAKLAKTFFESFEKFRKRYIIPKIEHGRGNCKRFRIAILDTGIRTDTLRPYLDDIEEARQKQKCRAKDCDPIKAVRSFTGDEADTGEDECGHGTHVASILLRLAPECDLYIAKISSDKEFDNAAGVVQAIDWAIDDCQADFINMSFGLNYWDTKIAEAIGRAQERKPNEAILFAAASNSGLHTPRTFPASDPRVIGVHSLDGLGYDTGSLNPSAHDQHDKFGTLGLGIKMLWDDQVMYKSGSSYATPTAVAIAANVMDWLYHVQQENLLSEGHCNFLRQTNGIQRLFSLQGVDIGNLVSVAPGTLFKLDLDQKKADAIICGRLEHSLPSIE